MFASSIILFILLSDIISSLIIGPSHLSCESVCVVSEIPKLFSTSILFVSYDIPPFLRHGEVKRLNLFFPCFIKRRIIKF